MSSVGKTIPHDSAIGHVTGEAPFIDDIPLRSDELLVGFVGSPVASGRVKRVDTSRATALEGVVGDWTFRDVAHNRFGPLFRDEPFLADGSVLYVGQPVVLLAAVDADSLRRACRAVTIEVAAETPILSIDEALAADRFIGPARAIRRGDAAGAMDAAEFQQQGEFRSGGQEQFYLESQAAIAYPGEEGQLVIHSSTQNTTEIQAVVAEVLGLSQHQVVCICKRMGGAFGGKETQAAIPALMAALVAHKTGRAARVVYTKDDDMCITGKRHPYLVRWRVGYDREGVIGGLKLDFFSDGGAAADLSTAVMERTMLHAENAYYVPDIEINGRVCFTNFPPNTAFRGFGGPQAVAAMENIIQRIAEHLGQDAYDVRLRNLYGVDERNVTPYGQIFSRNHLPEIMSTLAASSQYKQRLREIAEFNAQDKLSLRGIAMTPVKFGISFTSKFLNQANALVNVYTDGTIQVSTGGTEMGQGLNTKIRQLVADEMGVPYPHVVVMPTSTEKSNNTSPTAASAGTDLNGAAAIDACRKIKGRLTRFAAGLLASEEAGLIPSPEHIIFADAEVFDARRPDVRLTFTELVDRARRERIDLGARGFYKTPGVDYNRETGRGNPFLYYTQGAAVSEVLIDRFTGELSVPRVDLLIDIGKSINPGVDMGQITGGFIQGMGWATMECLVYDQSGRLLSSSPTTYKIPAITDVPRDFRCATFDNDDNEHNIRRSKAVGEPPLLLGVSVWAAVRHALSHQTNGSAAAANEIDLGLPATGEEILRCLTKLETAAASV
jgi:xanthine dehydrogenase large subunit